MHLDVHAESRPFQTSDSPSAPSTKRLSHTLFHTLPPFTTLQYPLPSSTSPLLYYLKLRILIDTALQNLIATAKG